MWDWFTLVVGLIVGLVCTVGGTDGRTGLASRWNWLTGLGDLVVRPVCIVGLDW